MYRKTAAVLAIVGLTARWGQAFGPFGIGCPSVCCEPVAVLASPCCEPVCCEPVIVEFCCDAYAPAPPTETPAPSDKSAKSESGRPATPPAPGPLPDAPSGEKPVNPPPTFSVPAQPPAAEQPVGQPASPTPSVPAGSAAEPGSLPLTDASSTPAPLETQPAETTAPRYSPLPDVPPPTQSSAPGTNALEDAFSEAPAPATESPTTPAEGEPAVDTAESSVDEQPPASTEPAEEPNIEDQLFSPATPSASDEQPEDESAPAAGQGQPAAEPADEKLESPFGPGASTGVLGEPGGWASAADRTWTDASGDELGPARLVALNGNHVTLRTNDGGEHVVRFSELSREDLTFLRRQIDARQVELARETKDHQRLANAQ